MADSFGKKEREKKKQRRKERKAEKKAQRKSEGNSSSEFLYVDEFGQPTETPPDKSKRTEIKLEDIEISVSRSEKNYDDTMLHGRVKFFNEQKRFGFIVEKESKKEYFVHGDDIEGNIKENEQVFFSITEGPKGMIAVNVKPLK